ncbi:acyltransferase family protein, partial [Pantoea septica]
DDSGLYGIRWTLNYEIWFYLLMACSLLLRHRWIILAALLITSLILFPLSQGQAISLETQGYAFRHGMLNLITNPIIWEFAAGVAVGLAWPVLLRLPTLVRRLLLTGILFWIIWHIIDRSHVAHGLTYSGGIVSLLLMAIAINDDLLAKLTPRVLIWLGNISYSLYLIHNVIMRMVDKRIPVHGVMQFLVALAISLFVAWLSQRYIEPLGYRLFASRSARVKTA